MYFKDFKGYLISLLFLLSLFAFSGKTTFGHEVLQPAEGEVLKGGSVFTIKWEIHEEVEPDANFDIRFSQDNGENWDVVVKNLESTVREFDWIVPNINTTEALIEVIEDRPSGSDAGARSGPFTIVKTKPFEFSCEDNLEQWLFGLEKLVMNLGNEQSCILKLTTDLKHAGPVEISTNLKRGRRASIEVSPIRGITDKNGELEFTITAINEGIDWISWAMPNSEGEFEFTKEAYDKGMAWGMFVEVK